MRLEGIFNEVIVNLCWSSLFNTTLIFINAMYSEGYFENECSSTFHITAIALVKLRAVHNNEFGDEHLSL